MFKRYFKRQDSAHPAAIAVLLVLWLSTATVLSAQADGTPASDAGSLADSGSDGRGQLVLNLDEVIRRGVEQNLNLQAAQIDVQLKARASQTAYNVFYPDISASGGLVRVNDPDSGSVTVPVPSSEIANGVYDYTTVQDYEVNPNILAFSLSAELPISLAMFDGLRALKQDYEGGLISYESALAALERDLKKNFYSLLLMQQQIQLTADSQQTMYERYQQTAADYQNGRVSEIALLNNQVAYENMGPQLFELEQSYAYAMARFKSTLGIDRETDLVLDGSIDDLAQPTDEQVLTSPGVADFGANFDLRLQRNAMDILETQTKAHVHQSFLPSLVLSASTVPMLVDPYNSDSWDDMFSHDWADRWIDNDGSISLMLVYPLGNILPHSPAREQLNELQERMRVLDIQEQQLLENLDLELMNLLDMMEASRRNIDSLELALRTNQRNVQLVLDAYQGGSRNLLDVQTAEDELRLAQMNLLNEKYRFLSYRFDLEYLLNRDVDGSAREVNE